MTHELRPLRRSLASLALVLVALAVGCAGPVEPATSTAVVVVHRQGELAPQVSDADLDALRAEALAPEVDRVDVHVVAAGRADDETVDVVGRRPNGAPENGPRRVDLVEARLVELQRAVERAARAGEDTDVLRALDSALRTGATRIIVLTAGLNTVDPLDMRVTGFDRDPESLAQELLARGALPDLHGRDIVFSGLGRTALPQQPLGVREQARLRAIWLALCRVAGGKCSVVDAERPSASAVSPLPAQVVSIPAMSTTPGPQGTRVFSVPSPLLFAPDSCRVEDRTAAADVLSPLAEQLRDGGSVVRISGRTAPVGPGDGVALAACRANAAAQILQDDLHVAPDAIAEVRGDGSSLDPPEASHDAAGRLDPTKFPGLRRVVFTVITMKEVQGR